MQGRDANRLLQRAIKAEDKRKKLPKLMTRLVESLSMWDDVEGRPFTLGSFRYQEDVLSVIQEELTLMDRIKPKKPVRCHGPHAVMPYTTVYTFVSISHPELVTTMQSTADGTIRANSAT